MSYFEGPTHFPEKIKGNLEDFRQGGQPLSRDLNLDLLDM
jgi:hypothetical protein